MHGTWCWHVAPPTYLFLHSAHFSRARFVSDRTLFVNVFGFYHRTRLSRDDWLRRRRWYRRPWLSPPFSPRTAHQCGPIGGFGCRRVFATSRRPLCCAHVPTMPPPPPPLLFSLKFYFIVFIIIIIYIIIYIIIFIIIITLLIISVIIVIIIIIYFFFNYQYILIYVFMVSNPFHNWHNLVRTPLSQFT